MRCDLSQWWKFLPLLKSTLKPAKLAGNGHIYQKLCM